MSTTAIDSKKQLHVNTANASDAINASCSKGTVLKTAKEAQSAMKNLKNGSAQKVNFTFGSKDNLKKCLCREDSLLAQTWFVEKGITQKIAEAASSTLKHRTVNEAELAQAASETIRGLAKEFPRTSLAAQTTLALTAEFGKCANQDKTKNLKALDTLKPESLVPNPF
jgi:lipopolysaccharide biosynthesis regulator YciM